MKKNTKWILENKTNYEKIFEDKREKKLDFIIEDLIKNRNLSLDTDFNFNPFNLKDMDIAVQRIFEAIKNNQKIYIYGDYDVDGITSVSLLYLALSELGANVDYYIPLRDEGYGLNKDAIQNLKNVQNGKINFLNSDIKNTMKLELGDILGIYGQNGSGKTTVIDALSILKSILIGKSLNLELINLITYGEKECTLTFDFYIEINNKKYIVDYKVILQKTKENDVEIINEILKYSVFSEENWKKKQLLIEVPFFNKFMETKKYKDNFLDMDSTDIIVNQKLARMTRTSFIFSKEIKDIIKKESDLSNIVNALSYFGHLNLFIVFNKEIGMINLNLLLPLKIKNTTSSGEIPIQIDKNDSIIINKDIYSDVEKTIEEINEVLKKIIPNLQIKLEKQKEEISNDGIKNIIADLRSIREGKPISLRYESEGIKRIVSILGVLIAVYNQRSVCLAIDELDSGIFEYLLGEILEVLSNEIKGQVIFTSHNLRILEKIDKKKIVFSTTNPNNRYIKFKYAKPSNNLRDMYLRELIIQEQDEELYKETKQSDIKRAFYRVGASLDEKR